MVEADSHLADIEPSLNEACEGESGDKDFSKDGRKLARMGLKITGRSPLGVGNNQECSFGLKKRRRRM